MVDSLDSGSSVHCGRAGSSPASPTKIGKHLFRACRFFYLRRQEDQESGRKTAAHQGKSSRPFRGTLYVSDKTGKGKKFWLTFPGISSIIFKISGCGEAWYRAWFGSKRPRVRIPTLRPSRSKVCLAPASFLPYLWGRFPGMDSFVNIPCILMPGNV